MLLYIIGLEENAYMVVGSTCVAFCAAVDSRHGRVEARRRIHK